MNKNKIFEQRKKFLKTFNSKKMKKKFLDLLFLTSFWKKKKIEGKK